MTEVQILDIMYEAFQLAMKLSLPFLLISMIVGVVIAVFQAATQINEQTMTFVPKLLAIMVLLGFLGSSMLVMLQEYFFEQTVKSFHKNKGIFYFCPVTAPVSVCRPDPDGISGINGRIHPDACGRAFSWGSVSLCNGTGIPYDPVCFFHYGLFNGT